MAAAETLTDHLDKAFDKAREEHSAAPPAKAEEPKSEPAPSKATEPEGTKPDEAQAPPPESEGADEGFLTKEQEAEILKNPVLAKHYKEMKGVFTKKTQSLAEQRKALEPLEQLRQQFQADPKGTVKQIIEAYKIDLSEAPKPETKAEKDAVLESLRSTLPEELKPLAEYLAPALKAAATEMAAQKLAPIEEKQKAIEEDTARRQIEATMAAFEKKHPEWKKHEAALIKEINSLDPKGLDEGEFLEKCYRLATWDLSEAERATKLVQKINESAKKADSPSPGVQSERVKKSAPKFANLNEALEQSFDDARQGINYE